MATSPRMAPTMNNMRRRPGQPRSSTVTAAATVIAVLAGLLLAWLVVARASDREAVNSSAGQGGPGSGTSQQPRRAGAAEGGSNGAGGSAGQQLQRAGGAAAVDNPEELHFFGKLSNEACKETERLRVCSHRAATSEMDDVPSGSLTAYAALFRERIRWAWVVVVGALVAL